MFLKRQIKFFFHGDDILVVSRKRQQTFFFKGVLRCFFNVFRLKEKKYVPTFDSQMEQYKFKYFIHFCLLLTNLNRVD